MTRDNSKNGWGFATRALHVGQGPDPATGAVVQPIHLATTFAQQGVGMLLVRAAESRFVARGAAVAIVTSANRRADAHAFYERHGYQLFATLDEYPPGHQRFFMRKSLAGAS